MIERDPSGLAGRRHPDVHEVNFKRASAAFVRLTLHDHFGTICCESDTELLLDLEHVNALAVSDSRRHGVYETAI